MYYFIENFNKSRKKSRKMGKKVCQIHFGVCWIHVCPQLLRTEKHKRKTNRTWSTNSNPSPHLGGEFFWLFLRFNQVFKFQIPFHSNFFAHFTHFFRTFFKKWYWTAAIPEFIAVFSPITSSFILQWINSCVSVASGPNLMHFWGTGTHTAPRGVLPP
jgi:hypothetical protein